MTAAEIGRLYRDARTAGVLFNSIWGGEPLVREDLPEILRSSHQARLFTILITSGFRFLDRFEELVPWLDLVIFSLDHPSPLHDEMRGMPGLFEAVNESIRRLKKRPDGPRVSVNSVISTLNEDAIDGLAQWARSMSVPIYFNPIEVGLLGKPEMELSKLPLAVDDKRLAEILRRLTALKRRGYPIRNSYTYLRTFTHGKHPYRCHARKLCLELRPNGDLIDCLDRFNPVANVRQTPLPDILARPDVRRRRLKEVSCHVCNNADVIDTSYVWELRPESVVSLLASY
jgi:MoaA/NifB/PqqE/SkfB family radical SAM enzyme